MCFVIETIYRYYYYPNLDFGSNVKEIIDFVVPEIKYIGKTKC